MPIVVTSRYCSQVEQRWVARYAFHWRALVSFKQRRDALAVWMDDNVLPRAVLDQDDALGVAVEHSALRITIDRSGFQISVGAPGIDISSLEAAFDGIFSIMRPVNLHIAFGRTLSSVKLDVASYDDARQNFARKCTGSLDDGFEIVDGAAAVDLVTNTSHLHVEFGVASKGELRERLRSPVRGSKTGLELPSLSRVRSEIPDVVLLSDVHWLASRSFKKPDDQDPTSCWRYVLSAIEAVNEDASTVGHALARNAEERGKRDELNRGA